MKFSFSYLFGVSKQWTYVCDAEARDIVEDGIQEDVDGRAARDEERSPPPVVVFAAEGEVDDDDGDLNTSDHEDDANDREETVHVVVLILPHRLHDKEELDEHDGKRQETTDCDARKYKSI